MKRRRGWWERLKDPDLGEMLLYAGLVVAWMCAVALMMATGV